MARKKRRPSGVSRRQFLKGLGIGGGALGAGLIGARAQERPKPAADVPALGPGAVSLALRINGQPRTVKVEPRTTLLDVLRDRLDLTGSKKICDRGECGGCTVLMDGRPVFACMLLAVDARRAAITTVEGLAPEGRLHPVQQAFVEKDALQCGFCTPGFVVAAKALLDRNPGADFREVREALCGHVCRCGTYTRVFEAVLDAAKRVPARRS
jgi:aerobic-type carbon monoxide dehydrogenase small subunit (CoxS/CutS family)